MTILTAAQFREHRNTSLVDDALGRLLASAEQAITARAGVNAGTVVDVRVGGTGLLQLSRRASSITRVDEVFTLDPGEPADLRALVLANDVWFEAETLEADDYALDSSGFWLQRLADGANPSDRWGQAVRVTYSAFDDAAERIRVQIALVGLDIDYGHGLASRQTEGYAESFDPDYLAKREAILRSLGQRPLRFA